MGSFYQEQIMSKWQAIVFDMDDTLYPEHTYVLSGFAAVAAWAEHQLGIPRAQGYAELHQFFTQGIRGTTFNQWLAAHGKSEERIPELVQVYRDHEPTIQPFPGIEALLQRLRQSYKLGMVSDGYLGVQQRKLNALGLARYLDAVVFSDEWGRSAWKPSVVPFQAIQERLGTDIAQTIYIGDNPKKDFLGARQLGMHTIWFRLPDSEYGHLQPPTAEHAPHVIVSDLEALQHAILEEPIHTLT
jgi:putative hydrolase of the HAD superfamily